MSEETAVATPAKVKKAETVINTVTMKDGRVVDFVGAKKKLVKESIKGADGVLQVRLDYVNGETRMFTLPAAMVPDFALHGAGQKLGDETAGLDDVEDCVLAVDELIDRLYNGEWSQRREGSGLAGTSILLRALVELYNKPIEEVRKFLSGKTQQDKIQLRLNPKVKPTVDRLEAEKVTKLSKVDTDAMLGELA